MAEDPDSFTSHRESGWTSAALGIGLAAVAEALPVHLLVYRSHPWLAWALTAASLYAIVWLIRDARALSARPTRFGATALSIRIGSRLHVELPYDAIASVTPVRGEPPPRKSPGYLRATVLGDPTLILELDRPLRATGPYGWSREALRIGLAPDRRAEFLARLARAVPAAASPARA